jgi:type II secretory pathway pseudopilin PulG
MHRGLTLIELILVVALIILIAALSAPFATGTLSRTGNRSYSDSVISTLRKAQMYSMQKKGGSIWGICLTETAIRVYRGSCNTPIQKEDTTISSAGTITGLLDTTFSAVRGEPSNTLSITVSSQNETTNIILNQAGGITIQ